MIVIHDVVCQRLRTIRVVLCGSYGSVVVVVMSNKSSKSVSICLDALNVSDIVNRAVHHEKLEGESWGKFSYAEYFENLRRARWVIALDASLSAGQVIAEASLLGIPTIAFAAKPNARLLLPDALVIAHDRSAEDIITFTMDVIDSYDSGMKSYDDLSALVRERATDRLTRVDVHDLELKFKSCCDSS